MKTAAHRPPLSDADLDRALATASDSIVPASGFTASVMAAVQEEAAAPAPIPFPWKRALPGLIAAAAAIVLLLVAIPPALHSALAASQPPSASVVPSLHSALPALAASNATWLTGSILLSLACLLFCRRLIAR